MNLIKVKVVVILSSLSFLCQSQTNLHFAKINDFYSLINAEIFEQKLFTFNAGKFKFTSLIVETENKSDAEIKIFYKSKIGIETYVTSKIDYNENVDISTYCSKLNVFEEEQSIVKIDFGNFKGKVKIILLYAPKTEIELKNKFYKFSNPCNKPPMISYTEWRKGLPNPKPPRVKTKIEHLVIHHSAGSNNDTDYLNTIRNIYLLHTQSNGWDDIGYNFLIAPDGTIFNGRDPLGAGDDDDILGAHFCSKNQNTMGICLMGNFMTKKPDYRAIYSLKYLLAWKLKKDKLDAFGQTKHPQPDGNMLDNICGHRNGCSTSCPGDSLYLILNNIKFESARIADSCGLKLDFIEPKIVSFVSVFPNPAIDKIYFVLKTEKVVILKVLKSNGSLVLHEKIYTEKPLEINLEKGIYFYQLISENKIIEKSKFMIF